MDTKHMTLLVSTNCQISSRGRKVYNLVYSACTLYCPSWQHFTRDTCWMIDWVSDWSIDVQIRTGRWFAIENSQLTDCCLDMNDRCRPSQWSTYVRALTLTSAIAPSNNKRMEGSRLLSYSQTTENNSFFTSRMLYPSNKGGGRWTNTKVQELVPRILF